MGKLIHFRKSVALTIIVIEASAKIYLQGRKRQRKQKLKKRNAFKIIFEDFLGKFSEFCYVFMLLIITMILMQLKRILLSLI